MSETAENTDETSQIEETAAGEKYLIFSIFEKLYCFPSRFIGEIALFDAVYPLPLMPSYVLGVVNRYSVPYALFDIGLLFYKTPSPRRKVLVLKDEIDRIAFLIDDVAGIADVRQEGIVNIERSAGADDFKEAVCASFDWDGNEVFVIDVNRIIERVSQEAV